MLLGKNETLENMSEVQTEEITRLRCIPDEKNKITSTQQVQSLSSSVDMLKLELDARQSETVQLRAEREILVQSFTE